MGWLRILIATEFPHAADAAGLRNTRRKLLLRLRVPLSAPWDKFPTGALWDPQCC